MDRATPAEPGREYPAWTDGRRRVEHAVTDAHSGTTPASGYLALCGRPVRWPVTNHDLERWTGTGHAWRMFDPDRDESCLDCAIAVILANEGQHRAG